MSESDQPRKPDHDEADRDEPGAEPAPAPEESRTPPHGDPLADEDDASSRGGVRD